MSRYSPQVLPTYLDLGAALRGYAEGKQMKRQRQFEDEDRARRTQMDADQRALTDVELYSKGVHRGAAPIDQGSVLAGQSLGDVLRTQAQPTGLFGKAADLTAGTSFAPPTPQQPAGTELGNALRNLAPSRYEQINPTYYVDREQTPEAVATRRLLQEMQLKQSDPMYQGQLRHLNAETQSLLAPKPRKYSSPIVGPNGEVSLIDLADPTHPVRVPGIQGKVERESASGASSKAKSTFLLKRITELTKPTPGRSGRRTPGLSRDQALQQATDEWNLVHGNDDPATPVPRPAEIPNSPTSASAGKGSEQEFADLAAKYQRALALGIDGATARQAYDADVMAVAQKYGMVK